MGRYGKALFKPKSRTNFTSHSLPLHEEDIAVPDESEECQSCRDLCTRLWSYIQYRSGIGRGFLRCFDGDPFSGCSLGSADSLVAVGGLTLVQRTLPLLGGEALVLFVS